MDIWQAVLRALVIVAGLTAVYGCHRILWYWHQETGSGSGRFLNALQEAVEPQARHVIQVNDQKRHPKETPGQGDPPHDRARQQQDAPPPE